MAAQLTAPAVHPSATVQYLPKDPAEIAALQAEVRQLAQERNAVILAHNYQVPEVQDVADFVGDSLGLAIEARKTNAPVIVLCGVYFMAETAKILNPERTVLIPDVTAGCSLADSITRASSCAPGRPSTPARWWSATSTRRRRSRPSPTTA